MKIAQIAAGLSLLFVTACLGAAQPRDLRAAIDAQVQANAEQHGIPAQAVLVMHNGVVLYRNQFGFAQVEAQRPVREDDVYAAYSVSKLFVSTLIFQLVDQGRLDLQHAAGRHIPDLPPAWRDVTIEQLLDHTSGLPDFFEGPESAPFPPTRDDMFRALADRPFTFAPGAETRYTQTNYVILAAILENHYGAPYREIVREHILEPLGLNDTYFGLANAPADRLVVPYRGEDGRLVRDPSPPWEDYSIAHAELYTTPDDLGAFLTAVARGEIVRQETLVRLWRPERLANGQMSSFASGWDYGEGGDYRDVGHDGGIKVRVRILYRGDDLGDHYLIVYLTNGTRDGVWTRRLVESVQRIVLRAEDGGARAPAL